MTLEQESTHKESALRGEILRSVNGSHLYGLNNEESDYDIMSIFIEPKKVVWGFTKWDSFPFREDQNDRTVFGEIDGTMFSLRRFLKLAADGNPSILNLLYTHGEYIIHAEPAGLELLDHKHLFVSKKAGPRFLGYMNNQIQRLRGEKKGHKPARPELVEKYGYDTKYAMHIYRLGLQGIEYLTQGFISVPLYPEARNLCRDVRNGVYSFTEINDGLDELVSNLEADLEKTDLPESPDYNQIAALSESLHYGFWLDGTSGTNPASLN